MILDQFGRDPRAPRPSLLDPALTKFIQSETLKLFRDRFGAFRTLSALVDQYGKSVSYPAFDNKLPRVGDTITIQRPERFTE